MSMADVGVRIFFETMKKIHIFRTVTPSRVLFEAFSGSGEGRE